MTVTHDTDTNDSDRPLIYHIFADRGVESEALAGYGRVVRVGLDPTDENASEPIRADANTLPLRERADLAVLHPECAPWSSVTSISGDPDDHPKQITLARDIGQRVADHYIIENVPGAVGAPKGLRKRDTTTLDGRMFGLPIRYERAFETSFPIHRVPHLQTSLEREVSPYFSADRSRSWWASAKGYRGDRYTKTAIARNAVPAAYMHHVCRAWLRATNEIDAQPARATHNT
jgi:hypothetical protein